MGTSLLETPLQFMYSVFGVDNDVDLCTRMSNIGFIYTCLTALYSLFVPAPYGRHIKGSSHGPTINAKLGWIIQECMSFFSPLIVISLTPSLALQNYANVVPLCLFLTHYFHRSFVYPLAMSSESKPISFLTFSNAILFTSFNGFLQGMSISNVISVDDSFYGFAGTIIFLAGMAINIIHDRMLVSLRNKENNKHSGNKADSAKQRYKIPRGGLFEYVSAANYLGEIIEWIGLALITREYPQIVFALFTALFLGTRAVHHHQFYKKTFGSQYPSSRAAIIPFFL